MVGAAVIVGGLIAISQGGGEEPKGLGQGQQLTGATQAIELFEGIPQEGASLGRPDAPVRMVEFVDLQCPFCAQYSRDVLPELVRRYVRTGKVRMELRPLTFIGPESLTAAKAAAAGARRAGWQFSEIFFANQGQENSGYVTPEFISRVAKPKNLRC